MAYEKQSGNSIRTEQISLNPLQLREVPRSTMVDWLDMRSKSARDAFNSKDYASLMRHISELERENAQLRHSNELMQQALLFFSEM